MQASKNRWRECGSPENSFKSQRQSAKTDAESSVRCMVRFLHTADWQIGATSRQVGSRSGELRRVRHKVVSRIAAVALDHGVDFMIVAGDTFESNDVDDIAVDDVVEILNSLHPLPIFMIPGNHDPATNDGVWKRQSWNRAGPHVKLLTEKEEVLFDDSTALYPCPVNQKRSRIDPTDWIPNRAPGDGRTRIGIAHGSVDALPGALNFPISSLRADECDLDYLALGDWHGMRNIGRAYYPGTPEQTKFGEQDAGSILIVDLEHGRDASVTKVAVGQNKWVEVEAVVREESDVENVRRLVASQRDLRNCLFRVRLKVTGEAGSDTLEKLKALRNSMSDSFFLDWPEESLRPELEQEGQLPPGMLSELDRLLSEGQSGVRDERVIQDVDSYAGEDFAEARFLLREYVRRISK